MVLLGCLWIDNGESAHPYQSPCYYTLRIVAIHHTHKKNTLKKQIFFSILGWIPGRGRGSAVETKRPIAEHCQSLGSAAGKISDGIQQTPESGHDSGRKVFPSFSC